MELERKRPWRLVVVCLLFIMAGIFGAYSQAELLRQGQTEIRLDALFLPLGIGLLLRWRFTLKLAQAALVLVFGVGVLGLVGVPFGITKIDYVDGFGPWWLQLIGILLLVVVTILAVGWMFAVTLRPEVENWFERGKQHTSQTVDTADAKLG